MAKYLIIGVIDTRRYLPYRTNGGLERFRSDVFEANSDELAKADVHKIAEEHRGFCNSIVQLQLIKLACEPISIPLNDAETKIPA